MACDEAFAVGGFAGVGLEDVNEPIFAGDSIRTTNGVSSPAEHATKTAAFRLKRAPHRAYLKFIGFIGLLKGNSTRENYHQGQKRRRKNP
jgi:hypothetical protein